MRTGFAIGLAVGALSSVFTPDEGEAPEGARLTEDNEIRLTEDDETRLVE